MNTEKYIHLRKKGYDHDWAIYRLNLSKEEAEQCRRAYTPLPTAKSIQEGAVIVALLFACVCSAIYALLKLLYVCI